jgi:Flp pilus assembly protein TadD
MLETAGDLAGAKARFTAAASLAPENAEIHFHLGSVLERTADREGAIREFQETLRLKPDHVEARRHLTALASAHL